MSPRSHHACSEWFMKSYYGIEDIEKAANARLPRIVREYIAGGASTEYTVAQNRRAFDRITFSPRVMVDVSERTIATTVLGQRVSMPVLPGPAGLASLVHPEGECAAARATAAAGSIFCISNASGYSLEQIAGAGNAPLWFQLFSCRDRTIARQFIDRARAARCHALILGVDLPIGGLRYRDARNGMEFPPRIRVRDLLDFAAHPRWLWNALVVRRATMGNYVGLVDGASMGATASFLKERVLTPAVSWDDLSWLRSQWDGGLVVKGILSVPDALEAARRGADAVVVSNHGGRQLDWLPATLDVLPEIADAVHGRAEVLIDGGVRHGADVVKALALGARACLVARPWYWALAAGGEAGVARMFRVFAEEIENVLGLIGRPRLEQLTRECLRVG
ncbi:alpha-hydroxy acid oxidase [Steroidobacter sp.]|uniref:alpha-hydroxy acid oxidase n=1 Tax=Steroidobacter sp. TaxID=1978227 RepID=UPI001A3D247D|nr:alpha-hydroxy acid oxidase [Steroidobacter sp.]MBL8268335.1 alpha-hydroxy-acid oxidizing protein [Steroidobacter sp.]